VFPHHGLMAQSCPRQYGVIKPVATGQCRAHVADDEVIGSDQVTPTEQRDSPPTMARQRSTSLVAHLSRFKASRLPDALPLSVATFCRAFPFHVMFNRRLEVVQAGVAMLRLLRRSDATSFMFADCFTVVKPEMTFSFSAVLARINTTFVVTTKPEVLRLSPRMRQYDDAEHPVESCSSPRSDVQTTAADESEAGDRDCLRLKGEMIYVRESDCVLFLCSPRVSTLDDLCRQGLYLSDIPMHDATRDLVLMTHARRAERELIEKLEETSRDLKLLEVRLNEDKLRTDRLLHSILPSNVAARLRKNQPVEAEKYDVVTVLFADIVRFTAMCGNELVEAMDIVRVLNKLYTQFDMLSTLNEVYKVGMSPRALVLIHRSHSRRVPWEIGARVRGVRCHVRYDIFATEK